MSPGANGSWRGTSNLNVDDGQSTESDAESSYQGWSDQGWRDSPASTSRPSMSSNDDALPPYHDIGITPIATSNPRNVSFQNTFPTNSVSHRRHTITRPGLHTASSNVALDALAPATVLNMAEVTSPAGITPSAAIPVYTESGYPAYPRSRRKSISHKEIIPVNDGTSETSPDEEYNFNGGVTIPIGVHGKGKKKRTRTASFSLPFHRRRRLSNAGWLAWIPWWRHIAGPRRLTQVPFYRRWYFFGLLACSALFLGLILWKRAYELQVELSLFSKRWIKHEFDTMRPLRGCFDPQHISPLYDMKRHLAPKYQVLTPGVSLKRGTQCYDFSSTVQPIPNVEPEHLIYHTYWRSDLIPFGERHTATLSAFLATQPLGYSKLVLWTNGVDVVSNNTFVRPFIDKWGDNIEVRQVDMKTLTKGTELEGILSGADGGGLFDERAWVDGDAVRLLVLWHYGGVWMDMDQILTRDIHPLIEHEFVTQWDCYDKPYFSLNGALMHFRQHSPYLCEAFHIMASSPLPKPNTFTWGAHLYQKLHRRLLAGRQRPFTVLPWCFSDPRNCRSDIRFPNPFDEDPLHWGGRRWDGRGEVGRSGKELLEEKVGHVWSVHLHNQWRKEFPKGGWMDRLLEGYRFQLDAIERYTKAMAKGGHTANTGGMNQGAGEEESAQQYEYRAAGGTGSTGAPPHHVGERVGYGHKWPEKDIKQVPEVAEGGDEEVWEAEV